MDTMQGKVPSSRFTCTSQAMSKGLYVHVHVGVHTKCLCSVVPPSGWHWFLVPVCVRLDL